MDTNGTNNSEGNGGENGGDNGAKKNKAAVKKRPWYWRVAKELPWLLVLLGVYFWSTSNQSPLVQPGEHLGDFRAPTLQGSLIDTADAGPVPLVLIFWAPWCNVCEAEFTILDELQAELGDKASVLGVMMDGSRGDGIEFLERKQPDFPNVVASRDLAGRFGVRAYPTIMIVDGSRTMRQQYVGLTTATRLKWALSQLRD